MTARGVAAVSVALMVLSPAMTPAGHHLDAVGLQACVIFRQAMLDLENGLLTDVALRQRITAVHDQARLSTTPGIAESSTAMLNEIMAGRSDSFMAVTRHFAEVCK